MILLIDNYDSFTYNLVQYLGELGATCQVYRNDQIDLASHREMKARSISLFPRDPAPRRKRAFPRRRFCRWPAGFPSWEYVWAINASARLSGEESSGPGG